MPAITPLVGRREELELGLALLAGPDSGCVVLAGPSGVGKTRLAAELARVAAATSVDGGMTGMEVAWAIATRATRDIPFGALLPVVSDRIEPAATEDGFQRLARLRAAVVSLASASRPLLLVVDDAQWLDEGSAALLLQLAHHPSIRMVLTVRSDLRAPEGIVASWKDGLAERIDLQLLARVDADVIVTDLVGGVVDAVTLAQLWDLTGGNALFVRELVLETMESGRLVDAGGVWTLRGNLRGGLRVGTRLEEILDDRFAGLSRACRRALDALAIGEPLALDTLAAVAPGADLAVLEERGLIRVEHLAGGAVCRVGHPLYVEVLRAQLPAIRHRVLAARLAELVDTQPGSGDDDQLRVALWQMEAGAAPEAHTLALAASVAHRNLDFSLAERLARAALAAGDPAVAADARLVLAEALNAQHSFDDAYETLTPMVDAPGASLSDAQRLRLGEQLTECLFWGKGDADASAGKLAKVRAGVSCVGADQFLQGLEATTAFLGGRTDEAAAVGLRLVDDPDADDLARLRAVPALGALAMSGAAEPALGRIEAMAELAARHPERSPRAPAWLLGARVLALGVLGRLDEAEGALQLAFAVACDRGSDGDAGTVATALGLTTLSRGLPITALGWLTQATALLDRHDPDAFRPMALALTAWAQALLGDVDKAQVHLDEADATHRPSIALQRPHLELARGWVLQARGDRPGAIRVLVAASEVCEDRGQRASRMLLAHEALRISGHDPAVERTVVDASAAVDGRLAGAFADHARALGGGDGDALEAAAGRFETIGLPLHAAEALARAADAHRAHGLAGPARSAAARSARLAASCEGARTPALTARLDPCDLTRRERDIAVLAAHGLSNVDIASRLVVSIRTVEGHLHNAYSKLGVDGRADLASVVLSDR